MRRSPRRPLILRRKLPFHQNESAAGKTQSLSAASGVPGPPGPTASPVLPDGIRILDHPSRSDTQVVVMLKSADLQSVIGALTVKGKECGAQGPNKFILLGGNDGDLSRQAAAVGGGGVSGLSATSPQVKTALKPLADIKPLNKDVDSGRLDDSLTNIQWLGKMTSSTLESGSAKGTSGQENQEPNLQTQQKPKAETDDEAETRPNSERPPFSYMAMIQFAINSRKNRRMTLKEIYTWFEAHFPYYREVAKPGWKNSIRHNLSLHDMFIRETSSDGKISYWTIRPEANRCLTLEQVYKTASDPVAPVSVPLLFLSQQQQQQQQQQRRSQTDTGKTSTSCKRRMKPLLPRTDSYLLPIQLPVVSPLFLPSPSSQLPSSSSNTSSQKQNASRSAKRVRIAPKVKQEDGAAFAICPSDGVDLKEEPLSIPLKCETPRSTPKRASRRSRRKQHLVHSSQEEPVLLCSHSPLVDSGLASDTSTLQSVQGGETDATQSPDREFSFKTPIKSGGGGGGGDGGGGNHLTSSTPSKPPCGLPDEAWKVTPLGKGAQSVLDFSPIRTPGGPAVTPRQDYTTYSLGGTPFKDWPLFNSPGELLAAATPAAAGTPTGPPARPQQGHSPTEGLLLDTMNDSLSNILVDISFSCLDDEDLGTANISWSELTYQFK